MSHSITSQVISIHSPCVEHYCTVVHLKYKSKDVCSDCVRVFWCQCQTALLQLLCVVMANVFAKRWAFCDPQSHDCTPSTHAILHRNHTHAPLLPWGRELEGISEARSIPVLCFCHLHKGLGALSLSTQDKSQANNLSCLQNTRGGHTTRQLPSQ